MVVAKGGDSGRWWWMVVVVVVKVNVDVTFTPFFRFNGAT